MYIRHNGKFLVNTVFTATNDTWTGNEYNKNERNYRPKNIFLRNLLNKVVHFLFQLEESGRLKGMTDKALKEQIEELTSDNSKSEKVFVDFIDEYIARGAKENATIYFIVPTFV